MINAYRYSPVSADYSAPVPEAEGGGKSKEGLMDQMSGAMDKGLKAVGNFFDKSRFRQLAFVWVVMPAITAVATSFILGQAGVFQNGLPSNPGIMMVSGLPILVILGGATVYGIVAVTGSNAPKKLKNIIGRIVRLAAFPICLAAFSWLFVYVINMQHGLASAQYSRPLSHKADYLQMMQLGSQATVTGLCSTTWMAILLAASVPLYKSMTMFIEELRRTVQPLEHHHHHASQTTEERLEMLRMEQRAMTERTQRQRTAEAESARSEYIAETSV